MSFLNWSAEYEFGIPEIDNQHRTWLAILNKFYDHVAEGNLQNKMMEMVAEAYDYTLYHFQSEEKFMRSIGYPKLEDQKAMHGAIAQKLKDFKTEIVNGKMLISTSLTRELKKWFQEHILEEDKQYAEFYRHHQKEKFSSPKVAL